MAAPFDEVVGRLRQEGAPVKAMILAAGRGTRLGSLGRSIPKVLVPIAGRPLLELQLEYLAREGFSRVVINAHHLADQIASFIESYRGPLEVTCIVEDELLGTAGGVRNALGVIGEGTFLVLYGDVIIDEPLAPLLEAHLRQRAVATLVVHEAQSTEGKGVVRVDPTGRVTAFEEKQHPGPTSGLINSGVYVIEHELVASLSGGAFSDFGEDVFPRALEQGLRIFSFRTTKPVIDIGTPGGLAQARARVAEAP
jgi:NDP-sugar pyrophosphorylase family protein